MTAITILLQILAVAACSYCFWRGGYNNLTFRREGVPLILALFAWYITQDWLVITMAAGLAAFHLGYGDNSMFHKKFGDTIGRGLWGALAAAGLATYLLISGHLTILNYIGYLALCFCLEAFLKDIPQKIGDRIIGAGYATLVFIIHK